MWCTLVLNTNVNLQVKSIVQITYTQRYISVACGRILGVYASSGSKCAELVTMRRVPEVIVCVVACWIMAASIINSNNHHKRQKCSEKLPLQDKEIIKPSITELTKEVRTNILCTVEGCGKILPNTPALNMHLVKSHRIQVQHYIKTTMHLLFHVSLFFTFDLLHFYRASLISLLSWFFFSLLCMPL